MRDFKIRVKKQIVTVSEEVYFTYYKMRRRERYLEEVSAEKELSYHHLVDMDYPVEERLFELPCSLEEIVIEKIMRERVRQALKSLSEYEQMIIEELFYKGTSLRELSGRLLVPRSTLQEQKERILKKLRKVIRA